MLEDAIIQLAKHALDNGLVIPGAEHDADGAARRQYAPERRTQSLVIRFIPEGTGRDVSGIQPFTQAIHHLTLASAFNAGDDNDDRGVGTRQLLLGLQQPGI